MPKDKQKRKDTSDSDSESGSSSDEPKKPPAKRQKSSATKSKSGDKSGDNEPQWQLSSDKLIKIREFKGKLYIDIRQYYNGPNGDLLPTKKGISLTPEVYQKFKKLIGEIDEELAKF